MDGFHQGLWEGGSVGTSMRMSQDGIREFLMGPLALAINILFRFFHIVFGIFNYF